MSFSTHVLAKGKRLAADDAIEETPLRIFKVYGDNDTYRVTTDFRGEASCTCPQGKNVGFSRQSFCSHVAAVLLQREVQR